VVSDGKIKIAGVLFWSKVKNCSKVFKKQIEKNKKK